MAPSRKPKLSSRARKLIEESRSDTRALAMAFLRGDSEIVHEAILSLTFSDRQLLLVDIANLRDESASEWFWRKWGGKIRPERTADVIQIRDELRAVWREPEEPFSETIIDRWSQWLPSQAHIEVFERLKLVAPNVKKPNDYPQFRCSIKVGGFVPDVRSLRAMLIQGIFEHWRRFMYCANPNCASPYFVAKRKDQTVCDDSTCKAAKQRQHALKWWTEHRAKRGNSKQSNGPPEKDPRDGSRKTR